jgi:hypothetical protein
MEIDHRQSQPEEQGQEPKLPAAEVAQRALQLLGNFKEAISHTPEAAQKLQELDFTEAQRADIWKAGNAWKIDYEKGDYRYIIKYDDNRNGQALKISKNPKKPVHDWSAESVSLSAHVPPKLPQFGRGIILDTRAYQNRIGEIFANTPTAIERVKKFLTTNFGDPQAQAPEKK